MSELLEGYDFYKSVQGTKYNKNDFETKKKLQQFRNDLGKFTDKVFNSLIPLEKGMWQNSGNFTKYMWNRYKLQDDNSTLVIYLNASTKDNEGIFLSIGLIDDKLTDFEKNNLNEIYNYLEGECRKVTIEGFLRKNTGFGERVFSIESLDKLDSLDYNELVDKLKNVYIQTYNKFYKKNYKDLYVKWMNENSKTTNSNKLQSYLKAINILTDKLNYEIFETDNIEQLKLLYDDLVNEQRNEEGKYYHKDAPSYGLNGFYSASIKSYIDFLKTLEPTVQIKNKDEIMKKALNQILYGPPGTGKTYYTINKALELICEKRYDDIYTINNEYDISYKDALEKNDRKALKGIFNYYRDIGQIDFITFHQSYGYEEFVEGIKAIPVGEEGNENGKEMVYKVVDGVFKSLVTECTSKDEIIESDLTNYDKANIWKMSLGNSQNGEDKVYYEEAVSTDTLIMGYGGIVNYSQCDDIGSIQKLNDHETSVGMIHRFKNELKTNDIVIISDGNRKFKAIVQVVGEYFYDENSDLKHKRKIKWLKKFTTSRSYSEISDRYFTQVTLNRPKGVDKEALLKYLTEKKIIDNTKKNYILIIDEINRGNISKIFGELITLIEQSKRIGEDEEIKVKLPYSGDEFGVPSNLYIIGTMNTADRSIALMDTALRRRFEFKEMMPDLDIVKDIKVGDIEIKSLLDTLNKRIEYLYDRDHTIGHTYFMSLKGKSGEGAKIELDNIFRNKIIPLLQEYFYDDWEKIQMVLGDHPEQKADDKNKFIKNIELKEETLFRFDHEEVDDVQVTYMINDTFTVDAYRKIRLIQEEQ